MTRLIQGRAAIAFSDPCCMSRCARHWRSWPASGACRRWRCGGPVLHPDQYRSRNFDPEGQEPVGRPSSASRCANCLSRLARHQEDRPVRPRGRSRERPAQADLDAYVAAFNDFMIESYVTRLDGYGGQSLKVTGVIDHAPGDYVVTAVAGRSGQSRRSRSGAGGFPRAGRGRQLRRRRCRRSPGSGLGWPSATISSAILGQHGDSVPAADGASQSR